MIRKSLTQIFNEEGGDKGSLFCHQNSTENIAHNYTAIYESYMDPYRDKSFSFLEIGLWCPYFPGASVRAWSRYFTEAEYYGIDIVDCAHLEGNRIHIDIIDQTSPAQLTSYIKEKKEFKFIIDDGVHEEEAITTSLGYLFPKLQSGGVYFIEDLHVVDISRLHRLVDRDFSTPFLPKKEVEYLNENIESCCFLAGEKMCVIRKTK
tara:strand:- start:8223 stop:8840 length:618 start_codon:yes stop_codon:yes gene_type:complete